jgi:hypothetical protein
MPDIRLPIPKRMADLPQDKHGRPVPWFVAWIDGQPDFRVIAPGKIKDALRFGQCWLCGGVLGGWKAFVIGPMCSVNRVSAEPPCHRDCAAYAAQACPFLATPRMVRRENRMPEGTTMPAGTMIRRNPGATLVWVTKTFTTFRAQGGVLFEVGPPEEIRWFAEGRTATRAEVVAAMESGLPLLRVEAEAESPAAVRELEAMYATALKLLPRNDPEQNEPLSDAVGRSRTGADSHG